MNRLSSFFSTAALLLLSHSARAEHVGGDITDSIIDVGSIGVLVGIVLIGAALAARGLRPKVVRVRR